MKGSISNKNAFLIFALLLVLGAFYVMALRYWSEDINRKTMLKGTYICGVPESGTAEYLMFTDGAEYSRYKQLQIAEDGTYEKSNDIVLLQPNEQSSQPGKRQKEYSVIFAEGKVFLFENKEPRVFERYSDMPMKIGVLEEGVEQ